MDLKLKYFLTYTILNLFEYQFIYLISFQDTASFFYKKRRIVNRPYKCVGILEDILDKDSFTGARMESVRSPWFRRIASSDHLESEKSYK